MKNILFSYPHSGLYVPPSVESRLNISKNDLILAMDFWTQEFFSGIDTIKVFSELHFLFWNLNRNITGKHLLTRELYNEANGLFPNEIASSGKLIYKEWQELSHEEQWELLETYYKPYYEKLIDFVLSGKVDFVVDVHSCDPESSGKQKWTGKRADIILGNLWDQNGEINPNKGYITFDTPLLQQLKALLESHGLSVSLNSPFSGGNITQQIGEMIPTLQIEVNKRVYMSDDLLSVDREKFQRVNDILEKAITSID